MKRGVRQKPRRRARSQHRRRNRRGVSRKGFRRRRLQGRSRTRRSRKRSRRTRPEHVIGRTGHILDTESTVWDGIRRNRAAPPNRITPARRHDTERDGTGLVGLGVTRSGVQISPARRGIPRSYLGFFRSPLTPRRPLHLSAIYRGASGLCGFGSSSSTR